MGASVRVSGFDFFFLFNSKFSLICQFELFYFEIKKKFYGSEMKKINSTGKDFGENGVGVKEAGEGGSGREWESEPKN